MAKFAFTLEAAPTLGGADLSIGENKIKERHDLALVSIAIPLGGETAVTDALQSGFGLEMPSPTQSTKCEAHRLLRTAPDQLLLIFPHETPDANSVVQEKLAGHGYTTDQTDAWVALEINGPDSLAALERLCPVDSAGMPEGGFARTVMEHMGAIAIRLGPERFLLLSASSSAGSFLHAVQTSFAFVCD